MRGARFLSLGFLSLFLFQNCGSFKAEESVNLYSYTCTPDFFYDVKLLSVEKDSANRERYIFDVVITYAKDTEQDVDYQLQFSTLKFSGVCPVQTGVASGSNKHFRVECIAPTPENLFVQMQLLGPNEEALTEVFRF